MILGRLLAAAACATLACATARPPGVGARPQQIQFGKADVVEVTPATLAVDRARALHEAGRRAEARATLDALLSSSDLAASDRGHALTERGAIELEDGDLDGAERSLAAAASAFRAGDPERRPEERHDPARALFLLGEVAHARSRTIQLDPARSGGDELARRLEDRSAMLLSAQERYLDAIRAGDAEWAIAAGARIGDMYDELQRDLLDAPLPPGLDGGAAALYQQELRQRVRVLVVKSIQSYQETLDAARRMGVESTFAAWAQEGLVRMHRLLDEIDSAASAPAAN